MKVGDKVRWKTLSHVSGEVIEKYGLNLRDIYTVSQLDGWRINFIETPGTPNWFDEGGNVFEIVTSNTYVEYFL